MIPIKCRGLLFDLDGVLVDSTPAVARVWAGWAREHGFDPDKVVREAHGRPSIATIRELLPHADHAVEDAPAVTRPGKAEGARALALRTTASDDELQQAGSDWIVDNCAALFLDSSSAGEELLLIGRRTQ